MSLFIHIFSSLLSRSRKTTHIYTDRHRAASYELKERKNAARENIPSELAELSLVRKVNASGFQRARANYFFARELNALLSR
jgi:hypothetical protein